MEHGLPEIRRTGKGTEVNSHLSKFVSHELFSIFFSSSNKVDVEKMPLYFASSKRVPTEDGAIKIPVTCLVEAKEISLSVERDVQEKIRFAQPEFCSIFPSLLAANQMDSIGLSRVIR